MSDRYVVTPTSSREDGHYVNIVQVGNAQDDLCHEITIPFVHHTMRLISLFDHLFQFPLCLQKS